MPNVGALTDKPHMAALPEGMRAPGWVAVNWAFEAIPVMAIVMRAGPPVADTTRLSEDMEAEALAVIPPNASVPADEAVSESVLPLAVSVRPPEKFLVIE